jgi:hypothetical protein
MSIGIWYAVQPNYLKAMGIPLLRGRFISPEDTENSRSIVVIDENFAREFFPNEDPIGKQIDTDLMRPLLRSEIVGIAGHTKQTGPNDTARQDSEGQFYYGINQGYNLSFQFTSAQGLQIRGKVLRLCVLGTELD